MVSRFQCILFSVVFTPPPSSHHGSVWLQLLIFLYTVCGCGLAFQMIGRAWPQAQSTYIPRVPQCLFPCPNWDHPHPLSRPRVRSPRPEQKGRGDTVVCGWGGGGPNSDDWRKGLALCLLCGHNPCSSAGAFKINPTWERSRSHDKPNCKSCLSSVSSSSASTVSLSVCVACYAFALSYPLPSVSWEQLIFPRR